MTKIDPDLLNLDQIIEIIDGLTLCNEELASVIETIVNILEEEDSNGDKIFKNSRNLSGSLVNIANYAMSIDELRDSAFVEIKNRNINQTILNKLERLNNKSSILLREYVPLVQAFRKELASTKEITKEDKEEFNKNMGHDLYNYLDTENRILGIITKGLKNHITENNKIDPTALIRKISNLYLNQDTKILSINFKNQKKVEVKLSNNEKELLGMILADPYIQFSNFTTYDLARERGGDKAKALKWIDNTSRTLNKKMEDQAKLLSFIIYNVDNIQINNKLIAENFLRNP
jgi:hypothetical protein